MKFVCNVLSVLTIASLAACSTMSMLRRIVPENTKYAINTKVGCNQYLYVTKKYPYNNYIAEALTNLQKNGRIKNFRRTDSFETTTFRINFIEADTINVSNVLIPWRGGTPRTVIDSFKKNFIANCDNAGKDTIYLTQYGKTRDKFVRDYDILPKYKFYPGR